MKLERKARIEEVASNLQKSISQEAMAIKELVGLLFENAKHNLVEAQGEDLLRLQGEAKAYRHLHTQLTRPSPVSKEQ